MTRSANTIRAIGLMSGTSLDGIDAAVLETDGEVLLRPGPALTVAYPPEIRAVLQEALRAGPQIRRDEPLPELVADAERLMTFEHVKLVRQLMAEARLKPADVDIIGFHGQTVIHRPDEGWTLQIGDGDVLAQMLGIDVINDLRSADMRAGGEGAPLASLYHAALVAGLKERPVGVVNIGGVANVTFIGDGPPLAFDTGPGNGPVNDWVARHTGEIMDRDGAIAAKGTVDEDRVAQALKSPYFDRTPPKSLDRADFPMDWVDGLSLEDGAATLTAFTAAAIARAAEHFPAAPQLWVICGGGRHNPALMGELASRLPGRVAAAEEAGWRGDFIEAEAFAYLAVRSMRGLPLTLPTTTGAREPTTGGVLRRARSSLAS